MAMTLQALHAALDRGLTGAADHGMLAMLVEAVATHAADPGLRRRCRILADGNAAADPLVYNVLCAGLFGVVPGDACLRPAAVPGEYLYRVNACLHGVRKAILACRALEGMRRANARSYVFYPEFLSITNLRQRVAALARAHAGMGPKNDELTVLYSLAGYFGLSDASWAIKVVGAGGTTSVMTARALYHAAGCAMIGERPLAMSTAMDASDELGTPASAGRGQKSRRGHWVQQIIARITVNRGDIVEPGAACNDNEAAGPPSLEVGDIYIVDGEGAHKYQMRGIGARTEHVGIIVEKYGEREFRTVDGGFGIGADVNLSRKREMIFKAGVGWTFADAPLAFSAAEVGWMDRQMQPYADDAAMEQAIDSEEPFAELRPGLARTRLNIDAAANDKLREMHARTLAMILANARLMKRQLLAAQTGTVRTIQGRWNPESYAGLQHASRDTIHRLLTA